jgi:DNA polymerase I-like protein with 3'-5' exonuclease and polymerase domains
MTVTEAAAYIARFRAAYPTLARWSALQKQALRTAYFTAAARRLYGNEVPTIAGYRIATNEQHYRLSRGAGAPEPWEDDDDDSDEHHRTPIFVGAGETRTLSGRRRLAVGKGTEMLNTPVQGSAADIIKSALVRVWEDRESCPSAHLFLCVHDELDFECPEEDAEQVAMWAAQHMLDAVAEYMPDVPAEVEVTMGPSWDMSTAAKRRIGRAVH